MDDEPDLSSELEETLQEHRSGAGGSDGTLVASQQEAYVGDKITLKGREFPPNATVDLVWHSTEGRWGVLEANQVIGTQYRPRQAIVATVETDSSGAFDEVWTVPEDYGGGHRIEARDSAGKPIAETEVQVRPWFELDRTTAPLGEAFTITGYGLGPEASTNNYQISWDTGYVGFVTGVVNRGTATARIRAAGPPGEHVLRVWRNYRGIPYLQNDTQSPLGRVAGGREHTWVVEVTEPDSEPPTTWMDPLIDEGPIETHYPDLDEDTEAELSIEPTSGQPGTTAFLTGRNFPSDEAVDLVWYQHVGEGLRGTDVIPKPRPGVLPGVRTDGDGRFQIEVEIPKAEGSTRPIVAEVDGQSVAVTGFMVQPSIERFEPTSGPVGTEIEIELSGIGWTAYENTRFFLYDNKPLGYLCGMADEDKGTTIRTVLHASGEPGYHFIDVYPAIFEVEENDPEVEILPHLSYLDNHPVRFLPGMYLTFEVTE